MVQHTDTHMATHMHMGEARVFAHTCMYMGYPYTRMGCPYAYGTAHTCMGRIPVWDGTFPHIFSLKIANSFFNLLCITILLLSQELALLVAISFSSDHLCSDIGSPVPHHAGLIVLKDLSRDGSKEAL